MKCTNCGAETKPEDQFCGECGAVVRTATIEETYEKHYDYSKRPTGVTILAVLWPIGVFVNLLGIIGEPQAMVVGIAFSGLSAQLVYAISMLIGIYLTYGFIKLLKPAWTLAIIFTIYTILNYLITVSPYISKMQVGVAIGIILGLSIQIIILAYILGKANYFKN